MCPVDLGASRTTLASRNANPAWRVAVRVASRHPTAPPPSTPCVATVCLGERQPATIKSYSPRSRRLICAGVISWMFLYSHVTQCCAGVLLLFSRFYRRTRLSGFQDVECVPCGDPPPANEPQCESCVWIRHLICSVCDYTHHTQLTLYKGV